MADPLQPNRIHSLPVLIHYQLSSSFQTFSTLLPSPAQVYIHAQTASSYDTDETWGSIYLKTVVEGIMMASPEIHPAYPQAPDLSLYILDPRETYLRRSRASTSSNSTGIMRHLGASSSTLSASPQSLGSEVWTGKGLTSWALGEPGQGKNLITGRLVQSIDFTRVLHTQGLSPMDALLWAEEIDMVESWGIEICLSLRAGNTAAAQPTSLWGQASQPSHNVADQHRRLSHTEQYPRTDQHHHQPRSIPVSNSMPRPHDTKPRLMPTQSEPLIPHPQSEPVGPSDRSHRLPNALSPARTISGTPQSNAPTPPNAQTNSRSATTVGMQRAIPLKKKKLVSQSSPIVPSAVPLTRTATPTVNASGPRPVSQPTRKTSLADKKMLPTLPDDVAHSLQNPDKLTKEQAERLIADPAFLTMLQQFTGHSVAAQTQTARDEERKGEAGKRAREETPAVPPRATKRTRTESAAESARQQKQELGPGDKPKKSVDKKADPNATVPKCWNCGRTKSAVWRTKVMDETLGTSVRVCNACGLYWNKLRQMRPASLWTNDDNELLHPEGSTASTSAEDKAAQAEASGFKRTLSAVVNQDAKRLASSKRKPVPTTRRGSDVSRLTSELGTIQESPRPSPATSPPRSIRTLPKAENKSSASSPLWTQEGQRAATPPPNEKSVHPPIDETPNTAVLRLFGTELGDVQSLAMPLSDDAAPVNNVQGLGAPSLPQFQQVPHMASTDASFDWNSDLSAFLSTDHYSGDPASDSLPYAAVQETPSGKSTTDRGPFSSVVGKGVAPPSTTGTAESDDVLSQLFNRTSSIGADMSSPAAFDFSALPPSSPPVSIISMDGLPHSALLLSSPDDSPLAYTHSPAGQEKRGTPEKSRLAQSFTPNDLARAHTEGQADKENRPPSAAEGQAMQSVQSMQEMSLEQIQELWTKLSSGVKGKEVEAMGDQWTKVFGHVATQ